MRSEVQVFLGPPFSTKEHGGVAQLGERLICIQEVIGSIPFTSTIHLVETKKTELNEGTKIPDPFRIGRSFHRSEQVYSFGCDWLLHIVNKFTDTVDNRVDETRCQQNSRGLFVCLSRR